jgi:methyltransferase (TIGR00027 family)
MTVKDETIQDVSDTSFLIAGYRAQETEKPNPAFKDPLARKLAGEKGMNMIATMPKTHLMAFAMVARTTAIDRQVYQAIEDGVDTVINLGAGLDTRPYRLDLPASLNWVEVDFPNIIKYKSEKLADDKPVCNLRRIATDLSDDTEREKLFHELGAATKKAVIITEGVIAYLSNEDAAKLADSLHKISAFKYWIMDYKQGKLHQRQTKMLRKRLANAPFRFDSEDPRGFFAQHGWRVYKNIYMLEEAHRLGLKFPAMFPWSLLIRLFGKKMRDAANQTYGYVMFERA